MIVTPTIIQFILTFLRIKNKTRIPILLSTISTFILGFIMASCATIVSTYGFIDPKNPNEPHCATGAVTFIFFGMIITFVMQPLIGIIGGLIYKNNEQVKNSKKK